MAACLKVLVIAALLAPVVAAAALLAPVVAAAALPDPTLPGGVAASSDGATARAAVALTAIKRKGAQRVAVIGGQEVGVGGHYDDARVVRITENEVVLRRGEETAVLTLFPLVPKRLRER